jgi:DNA repair protein RadA/Sms
LIVAKLKTRYLCQACGSEQHRWQGQCPDCAEWNTLVQEASVSTVFAARHDLSGGGRAIDLVGLDAVVALPDRMRTGIEEFDRAIGGGIVPGSAMLLGGDPGIGKSTLLLQVAAELANAEGRSSMCRARKPSTRSGYARSDWAWGEHRCSWPRPHRCATY